MVSGHEGVFLKSSWHRFYLFRQRTKEAAAFGYMRISSFVNHLDDWRVNTRRGMHETCE